MDRIGRCPPEHYTYILSIDRCEAAAEALGLTHTAALSSAFDDGPRGCYYKPKTNEPAGSLYFNRAQGNCTFDETVGPSTNPKPT